MAAPPLSTAMLETPCDGVKERIERAMEGESQWCFLFKSSLQSTVLPISMAGSLIRECVCVSDLGVT